MAISHSFCLENAIRVEKFAIRTTFNESFLSRINGTTKTKEEKSCSVAGFFSALVLECVFG